MKIFLDFPKKYNPAPAFDGICGIINLSYIMIANKEVCMNYPEIRYLERLADLYPTIAAASTEVINMEAILNLPKGTEHFLTDIQR